MNSIYQQSSSSSSSSLNSSSSPCDNEQDSVTKSETLKSVNSNSKQSYNSSIAQMAKFQLLNYQDINDDQFVLLPQFPQDMNSSQKNKQISSSSQISSIYMNQHATVMPVGINYQAKIPNIITYQNYLNKTIDKFKQLELRKVHDPSIDNLFYTQYHNVICDKFGEQRSYQDVNHMRINFMRKSLFVNFQKYLEDQNVCQYWQSYFVAKAKSIYKLRGRKRKNK